MDTNFDDKMNHQHEPEFDEITNDKFISGHEYDNIRELDNNLPPWWVWLFVLTIVFSAVYLLRYHVLNLGDLQAAEYESEITKAEMKYKPVETSIDENTVVAVNDEVSLAEGKTTFDKICSVCHGKLGEGLVGPNFKDNYWIHGSTINDMYKVVITGVIEKGMISYKDQLSPKQIQNVLSYILTLQGPNPPNAKAPEGIPAGDIPTDSNDTVQ